MKAVGKNIWLIPDCYLPVVETSQLDQAYQSHEAICVLNTSDQDAQLLITLYFEDREPSSGLSASCGARRTHHIRMDKIVDAGGAHIQTGVPYAVLVESNIPVIIQYSRLDATQPNNAMITTLAYSLD